MTKDWRHDGESAVINEMIARAFESPEKMCSRSAHVGYNDLRCDVCMGPLVPWSTYQVTCYIEDGEPQFVRHHIICPKETTF